MIAIVVDSTSYITRSEAQQLGVSLAPVTYIVADQMYHESYSDRNGAFETLIFRNAAGCKTSQPNTAVFMSAFNELLRKGYDVLCLTLSSRLSGTYSSACIAAREVGSKRIAVVDSLSVAGGLYLLVKYARELADAGRSLDQIEQAVLQEREKLFIAFSVDDMEPLRRSGRLGIVRQSIGTILNVRPMLMCVDGAVISDGIVRGKQEQIKALSEKPPQGVREILVHYILDIKSASALAGRIRQLHPKAKIELRPLGPVLAVHLGLSVIGVAWKSD